MQPETAAKIELWRAKALAGTITKEELREALACLRFDRQNSAPAEKKTGGKKQKPADVDSDALLKELDGL